MRVTTPLAVLWGLAVLLPFLDPQSRSLAQAGSPVSWAVKLALEYGDVSSGDHLEMEAKKLARVQRLQFAGRVDPFPDIFLFELPQSTIEHHVRSGGHKKRDSSDVEDFIHQELNGHPSVEWAGKQVGLRRVKRMFEFADPAFDRQWHLVSKGNEAEREGRGRGDMSDGRREVREGGEGRG